MASFSGLGFGLSLLFGCLLLAIIVAELYYVLWWKKRITRTRELEEDDYSNYAKELIQLFCWKKPIQSGEGGRVPFNNGHVVAAEDPELGSTTASKDLFLKASGDESEISELMRLHNLAGPPRFLFTIKEETKEDLESDGGKSRGDGSRKGSRTRSSSDLNSPFLTPLASPTLKSPLADYHSLGFNPLFESSPSAEAAVAAADLSRLRSSPPPKFKFLRDAEEKLLRKLREEAKKKRVQDCSSGVKSLNTSTLGPEVVREGSFLKFIVGHHHYHPSSSSQVHPLASSPTTTFRLVDYQRASSPLSP